MVYSFMLRQETRSSVLGVRKAKGDSAPLPYFPWRDTHTAYISSAPLIASSVGAEFIMSPIHSPFQVMPRAPAVSSGERRLRPDAAPAAASVA